MTKGYDYVIVGAGSAGCVLANRLSADGAARVLILEAGPRDRHPLIHIPLGLGKMHEYGMFDWGYQTDPEPNLNNRRIEAMRGKVLGGSSSINVMAYTRGNRGDYDRWAQKGARGWSYADVLPYFQRCETFEKGANTWRGGSGPVGTEFARTRDPLYEAWIAAGEAAGYPFNPDYNGRQQEGFGHGQYTIRYGRRSSSANAFLKPARRRKNLIVALNAHTTRITLNGTRATGVEYVQSGGTVHAEAAREVILATLIDPPDDDTGHPAWGEAHDLDFVNRHAWQPPIYLNGPFLGFLGGVVELGPLLQRQARPFGGQPGPVPGLLADLLVDAEREQLDEQFLALARLRLEEVGEPALRQQHRLNEVVVAEPEDVLDLRLDRVGALGEVLNGGAEKVGQRRIRRDGRVEQV